MEHEESGTPHTHYYFHLPHATMQHIIDYLGGRAGTVMSTELLTHRLTEQLGRNVRVTQVQIPGAYVEYRLGVELRNRSYQTSSLRWRDTMEFAARVGYSMGSELTALAARVGYSMGSELTAQGTATSRFRENVTINYKPVESGRSNNNEGDGESYF